MISKRRQNNIKKTHCVNGHPFAGSNLRVTTSGTRVCRQCGIDRKRRCIARQRQARIDASP